MFFLFFGKKSFDCKHFRKNTIESEKCVGKWEKRRQLPLEPIKFEKVIGVDRNEKLTPLRTRYVFFFLFYYVLSYAIFFPHRPLVQMSD